MVHSKILDKTALWKSYQDKIPPGSTRGDWVKEVCEAAAKYMLDVRRTFQNYTLHDETHIINVLDAMGGLLGDQVDKLTVGEAELLILPACTIWEWFIRMRKSGSIMMTPRHAESF